MVSHVGRVRVVTTVTRGGVLGSKRGGDSGYFYCRDILLRDFLEEKGLKSREGVYSETVNLNE